MNIDSVKSLKSKVQKAVVFFRPLLELEGAIDEVLGFGALVAEARAAKEKATAEIKDIHRATAKAIEMRESAEKDAERIIAETRLAGEQAAQAAIDRAQLAVDEMDEHVELQTATLDILSKAIIAGRQELEGVESEISAAQDKLAGLNQAIDAMKVKFS